MPQAYPILLRIARMMMTHTYVSLRTQRSMSDTPDTRSQKYATSLNHIFSARLDAPSWRPSAGMAMRASIAYHQLGAASSRKSIRKVVANVSQNQNMSTRDVVQ
jgi:hypothetical protein